MIAENNNGKAHKTATIGWHTKVSFVFFALCFGLTSFGAGRIDAVNNLNFDFIHRKTDFQTIRFIASFRIRKVGCGLELHRAFAGSMVISLLFLRTIRKIRPV